MRPLYCLLLSFLTFVSVSGRPDKKPLEVELPEEPLKDELPEEPLEDELPEEPVEDELPEKPVEDELPEKPLEDELPKESLEDEYLEVGLPEKPLGELHPEYWISENWSTEKPSEGGILNFAKGLVLGTKDVWKAMSDKKKAGVEGADEYFAARGNFDAAQRGPGGKWAAKTISNVRKWWQGIVGSRDPKSIDVERAASEWGRAGGDPNKFRPDYLPPEF